MSSIQNRVVPWAIAVLTLSAQFCLGNLRDVNVSGLKTEASGNSYLMTSKDGELLGQIDISINFNNRTSFGILWTDPHGRTYDRQSKATRFVIGSLGHHAVRLSPQEAIPKAIQHEITRDSWSDSRQSYIDRIRFKLLDRNQNPIGYLVARIEFRKGEISPEIKMNVYFPREGRALEKEVYPLETAEFQGKLISRISEQEISQILQARPESEGVRKISTSINSDWSETNAALLQYGLQLESTFSGLINPATWPVNVELSDRLETIHYAIHGPQKRVIGFLVTQQATMSDYEYRGGNARALTYAWFDHDGLALKVERQRDGSVCSAIAGAP